MRLLRILDKRVVNVIVSDEAMSDYVEDQWGAGVGWVYDGQSATPPPRPELTPAEQHERAKAARDTALEALTHDYGDGRVMQIRPADAANIRGAIELLEQTKAKQIGWVMLDNIKHPVTLTELRAALKAGLRAAAKVWDDYEPVAL